MAENTGFLFDLNRAQQKVDHSSTSVRTLNRGVFILVFVKNKNKKIVIPRNNVV